MAEAFVPLLEKLADFALNELQTLIALVVEVKDKVRDLSIKLNAIKKMLRDVEMKKMKKEDKAVDVWLEQLEELAYEMDDVLDRWITETSKLEIEASQNLSSSRNVWEKVRSFFLPICFCAKEVSIRHDIAEKIQELTAKVDHILTEAKKFEFTTTDHRDSSKSGAKTFELTTTEASRRPFPTVIESEVWGRESDENIIISKLLSQNRSSGDVIGENQIRVVSIVGVGGLGKTTLARKVSQDQRVKEHFDHMIWVTVSNPFVEKRIAEAILEGLGSDETRSVDAMFNCIRESLKNKKFLLILDDVWTENHTEWQPFRDTLKDGAPESRILVTTRKDGVAIMLGSSYIHRLSPLKDDDSWLILSRNAFSPGSKAPVREKVENLGQKIASKCHGLPLAASFMGNLLKFKYTVAQWQEVLSSELWELEKVSEGIFAHLYLSYNELDPVMQRCFSYCAVFPKASRIVVEQLIRIWIAQGFLSSSGSPERLESRGRECFNNLAMRSFFQDFERDADGDENQITRCKIHDIVHDFAIFLTDKECSDVPKVNNQGIITYSDKVRHLSLMPSGAEINLSTTGFRKLRSIFCSGYVPPRLFTSLNSIRVLSLQDCGLQELPNDVGNFIHLRYIDLSHNPLTELPEAICCLYNLETLDINSCRSLTQLPQGIGNLIKLRCLINPQTESLRQFPQGFQRLTSLRTLSEFKVGHGFNKLGYLKSINQLLGSMEIVIDASDTVYLENGELKNKKNLQKLTLRFSNSSTNANDIEALQPPPNLENLILQGYGGTSFPSWVVTSLDNLRVLDVRNSNASSLPALGNLPFLEILTIYGTGLKVLGRDFLGIREPSSSVREVFPRLKKLSFESLEFWKTWEDITEEEANSIKVMPHLRELNLYKCNSLMALPHRILSKASSLESKCFTLNLKVCLFLLLRYSSLLGDEWKEISHIPNPVKDFH